MKTLQLYLAVILSLASLSAFADIHHEDILNLKDLIPVGKKEEGCNAGGVYKDGLGSKYFIKTPGYMALPAHEYIVGKLLSLVDNRCFATTNLIEGYPEQVSSKFLEGFVSYRKHGVRNAGQLRQETKVVGIELLLAVKNWLGIEDENPGNIGTIPWDNNTLHFTRIDYDTAFYFDTYEQKPLNFKVRGIKTLNEDALIDALELIANMPEGKLEETLMEIYANLDHVGVHYTADQRAQLESFLASRQQTFEQYYQGFRINQEILRLIEGGHLEQAKDAYLSQEREIQEVIQREWLLHHYTRTRGTYSRLVAEFPEILNESETLTNENGYTPLHMAIEWEDANLAKLIFESSYEKLNVINARDNRDWTPMHLAAQKGAGDTIKQILKYSKTALDAQTNEGKTPLHIAAESNTIETTSILIEANANIEAIDSNGNTPLLLASEAGSAQTGLFLIKHNANILQVNDAGETALHTSVRGNAQALIDTLADLEPNLLSVADVQGMTALHTAIIEENSAIVSNLISRGADTCEKTEELSAIDLAMLLGLDLEIFGDNIICP